MTVNKKTFHLIQSPPINSSLNTQRYESNSTQISPRIIHNKSSDYQNIPTSKLYIGKGTLSPTWLGLKLIQMSTILVFPSRIAPRATICDFAEFEKNLIIFLWVCRRSPFGHLFRRSLWILGRLLLVSIWVFPHCARISMTPIFWE